MHRCPSVTQIIFQVFRSEFHGWKSNDIRLYLSPLVSQLSKDICEDLSCLLRPLSTFLFVIFRPMQFYWCLQKNSLSTSISDFSYAKRMIRMVFTILCITSVRRSVNMPFYRNGIKSVTDRLLHQSLNFILLCQQLN